MRNSLPGITTLALAMCLVSSAPADADIRSVRGEGGVIYMTNRPERSADARRPGQADVRRSLPAQRGPAQYDDLIREAANRYGVDFGLIKAVVHAESAFNPRAVSRVGAEGLMQLMPATARDLRVGNSFDPRQNIFGGARYLRQMLEKYGNDIDLSLAAYNAGPTVVDRLGRVPRYAETRNYIRRVKRLMDRYASPGGGTDRIYQVVINGRVVITNRPLP